MLPGLIPAALGVLAVFVVCVAAGYFWTRALWPAGDSLETLAFSVAFSITLVPAVALVPASLFGLGVTLPVTVLSVALVFGSGLAAYLWLGSVKEREEPVFGMPGLVGPRALALLSGSLAFALVSVFGLLPELWASLLALAFALLAGAAWLLEPVEPIGEARLPVGGGMTFESAAKWVMLSVIFALVLVRGYIGPVLQDWPYLRGDDQYEHSVMAGMMLTQGSNESFMVYPPGLHLLTAEVSRLSGLEPLEIFPVVAPAFLLMPAICCYVLAKRLWGWEVGVAAAFIGGLMLGGSYYYLEHARYPNLISTQFLMVLALAALIRLWSEPSVRNALPFALVGSSVVLYSQVGSLYLALLLAFVAAFPLLRLFLRDRRRGAALFASFSLLGLISVAYAWDTYDLGSLLAGLFFGGSGSGAGGDAVAMALGTKQVPTFKYLLEMTTHPVLWLGVFGVFILAATRRGVGETGRLARVLLLAWVALMFLASRTSFSAFPDRFTRDIGVPLTLLAALVFVVLLRSFFAHARPRTILVSSAAVSLATALLLVQSTQSIVYAAAPNPQLTMTPSVAAAGDWLEEHNTGGNILATPYVNSLPSRGVLAMGGYTGMQSYTAGRIEWARDLPPSGAKPLKDALYALQNPGSDHTSRLFEKYDVRYVVVDKEYPGIEWRLFLYRPDLYEKTFENDEVAIFAPRGE